MIEPVPEKEPDWNFPFEGPLHEVFPALHEAQNAWLAQIDSLQAPDRKTHELIRMVCTVILRNPEGVQRHAMLAKEVGSDLGGARRVDHADPSRLRPAPGGARPCPTPAGASTRLLRATTD